MVRIWIGALVLLAMGLPPGTAGAQGGGRRVTGGLGPFVPSQLVHLVTPPEDHPPGCGGASSGYPIDQRVNPDGSLESFSVPAGQVLVLTSASWGLGGLNGPALTVVLFLVSGDGPRRRILFDTAQPTAGNNATGRALLGDVLMRAGDTLCIATTVVAGGGSAVVHGFLTADE